MLETSWQAKTQKTCCQMGERTLKAMSRLNASLYGHYMVRCKVYAVTVSQPRLENEKTLLNSCFFGPSKKKNHLFVKVATLFTLFSKSFALFSNRHKINIVFI